MVSKFKEYWFGTLLFLFVIVFMLFIAIVAIAPHNDGKMRGFAPCTYRMAYELGQYGENKQAGKVFSAISGGYFCYAGIMADGVAAWLGGRQKTPWANYIFKAETFEVPPELDEPFSEDLLKANRLNDPYPGDFFEEIREDGQAQENEPETGQ